MSPLHRADEFAPTDEELGLHLIKKLEDRSYGCGNNIREVPVYSLPPDQLIPLYGAHQESPAWYFFTTTTPVASAVTGTRQRRCAGNGWWKATGRTHDVLVPIKGPHADAGAVVESRRVVKMLSLTYHAKDSDDAGVSDRVGRKTEWLMKEFRVPVVQPDGGAEGLSNCALCKVYRSPRRLRWGSCRSASSSPGVPSSPVTVFSSPRSSFSDDVAGSSGIAAPRGRRLAQDQVRFQEMQLAEANEGECPSGSELFHAIVINEKPLRKEVIFCCKDSDDGTTESPRSHDEGSDDESTESPQNQLICYKPTARDTGLEITRLPNSPDLEISLTRVPVRKRFPRSLPSRWKFAAQCARCFQWRLIPANERYEEVRERILQEPFYCETAQEWCYKPSSSSDLPEILEYGSTLWVIDKPDIPHAPPGWERLLRIHVEEGRRFALVCYISPSGKQLRSMVEIQKYLLDHPECASQGVSLSQFSFHIPQLLQEDYVGMHALLLAANADGCTDP